MLSRVLTASVASLALLSAAPVLAAPANPSAAKLSLSKNVRAGAPASSRSSKLGSGSGGLIAAALAAGIAAILVIDLVIDDDDNPTSP